MFKVLTAMFFIFLSGCNSSQPQYLPEFITNPDTQPVFQAKFEFANPDIQNNKNFRGIKKGFFSMGSPQNEANRSLDETLHGVVISRDFEIQATVVTQAQYFLVMGVNPTKNMDISKCTDDYLEVNAVPICPNKPVTDVSWIDAQNFILKLNSTSTQKYRLPTEAEWELAARAGSEGPYYFSDTANIQRYTWYSVNSGGSARNVGLKLPNQFGLYDMLGNVKQWVSDGYSEYSETPQTDPVGSLTYEAKVLRGGSYEDLAANLRSAARLAKYQETRTPSIGFRLVRVIP